MTTDPTTVDYPPGPSGLPIVGAVPASILGGLEFRERVAREYGDIVHWSGLGDHYYMVSDPEAIAHVLVHNNDNYVKGELFQRSLRPLTGNGILNSEEDEWRRNRHLIQPAFHPDRIDVYAELMCEEAERTIGAWTDGETRSIHDDMMELTLRIVSRALFGVNIDPYVDDIESAVNDFLPATSSLSHLLLPEGIPLPARRRMARARATLADVVDDIVRRKRADPGDADVISMLLAARDENENPLSDEQIRDEAITLLTAGHETTAVALTYTTYLLAQHPEIERRLVDELDRDRPTVDDVSNGSFVDRVVKESMRLYPPVPGVVREAKTPDRIGGYRIPAGATVFLSQWVTHRDGRWYDDPLAFRPDRWSDEVADELPQLAYFPFAAGPRRCVGDRFAMVEAKLLLATIYREYHLELASNRALDIVPTITSRPKEDVLMRVHERRAN
ncbi:cytochrome P450 [Halovivax gelatinilyticus]|uniref:cytochrome P450 n=1 Tax=Halovivax gelatinilyticus TaxID=2961597 RepID=UPI0020CA3ABE|nr:cytochrome P450 [Halovivax gelatinilyticus]